MRVFVLVAFATTSVSVAVRTTFLPLIECRPGRTLTAIDAGSACTTALFE